MKNGYAFCYGKRLKGSFFNCFSFIGLSILIYFLTGGTTLRSQTVLISRAEADYCTGSVPAICSTAPFNPACKITLCPYIPGERYFFRIPLVTPANRPNTNFTFIVEPTCDQGSVIFGGDSLLIEAATPCICIDDTIRFAVMAIYDNGVDPPSTDPGVHFLIPISRKPVKIAFVLDVSGSMGSITTGGSESRIEVLKKTAYLFVNELCNFAIAKDSCAMTYFTDYLLQPGLPINNGFMPITGIDYLPAHDRTDSVFYRDMKPRTPLNLTAMGMGLIDGKNKLLKHDPADFTKIVFLFTDGLQNVLPEVNADGITLTDGTSLNDFSGTAPHDTIHYYPIGICSVANLPTVLSAINSANSGSRLNSGECLQTSDADALAFQEFFDFELPKALKGNSPQLIFRKTGNFERNDLAESFRLNSKVDKILLKLVFPAGSDLSMKIEKDGKDITQSFRFETGPYYQMARISIPGRHNSAGEYKIRISGGKHCTYALTGFADDHYLDYTCTTDKYVYTVGDPINLAVRLTYNGKPLSDPSNEITAIILKPGEDIGNLLARSTVDIPASAGDFNPVVQKHIALLNRKEYVDALRPTTHTIKLTTSGNGLYKGKYSDTKLTGIYKVYYIMKGQIPGKGTFERLDRVDAVLKFGQLSTTNSMITIKKDSLNHISGLIIRPVNNFGNYIGPGFKSMIKIEQRVKAAGMKPRWIKMDPSIKSEPLQLKSNFQVTDIKDLLDGTYEIKISIKGKQNPLIRVSVMDEVLREKKFKCIVRK